MRDFILKTESVITHANAFAKVLIAFHRILLSIVIQLDLNIYGSNWYAEMIAVERHQDSHISNFNWHNFQKLICKYLQLEKINEVNVGFFHPNNVQKPMKSWRVDNSIFFYSSMHPTFDVISIASQTFMELFIFLRALQFTGKKPSIICSVLF